jgi:polysaccharide export outer membrane protein
MARTFGRGWIGVAALTLAAALAGVPIWAQQNGADPKSVSPGTDCGVKPAETTEFTIGAGDVLFIFMDKEPTHTRDRVPVRPDGKITLTLVDDIQAAGRTTEQLKADLTKAYDRFIVNPVITVGLVEIHSRKVCIQGMVMKTGCFSMTSNTMDIMELVTLAGGLQEYSKKKITIYSPERRPDGVQWSWEINYGDLFERKNVEKNNIQLKPGFNVMVR